MPEKSLKKHAAWSALILAGLATAACGNSDKGASESVTTSPTPTPSTTATPTPTPTLTPSLTETVSLEQPLQPEPSNSAPRPQVQQYQRPTELPFVPQQQSGGGRADLYPIACQAGMGPVVTTWSDGSIGGWSQMCQDVHDQAAQAEREANTPVCDGTVCTYPNGNTVPDPRASIPPLPQDPTSTPETPETPATPSEPADQPASPDSGDSESTDNGATAP